MARTDFLAQSRKYKDTQNPIFREGKYTIRLGLELDGIENLSVTTELHFYS